MSDSLTNDGTGMYALCQGSATVQFGQAVLAGVLTYYLRYLVSNFAFDVSRPKHFRHVDGEE